MNEGLSTGIDIGSTTVKMVVCDDHQNILFSAYERHQARPIDKLKAMLDAAQKDLGDRKIDVVLTGSAGMGIAETLDIPFVQEVVASVAFMEKNIPDPVRTFIEIGGEDSKIVFLSGRFQPDIRMNGSCAGGTGAFIDQMAAMLGVKPIDLDRLAQHSQKIYPIASRCGVFAKTDVTALLSRKVPKEDIAASIFHAVASQVISALARGRTIESKILFGGGPLTFFSALRRAFCRILDIDDESEIVHVERPELIPALGAAAVRNERQSVMRISELKMLMEKKQNQAADVSRRLPALFSDEREFSAWERFHAAARVPLISPEKAGSGPFYLGIDSGSTTTKVVCIDEEGNLVAGDYRNNDGDPIQAVSRALSAIKEKFEKVGHTPVFAKTAVTGYGEGLIKAAFGIDEGVVETMAHYRAARHFVPDVSFILDIGGQDMKAIRIENGAVSGVEINEACSSGCGSFIETFAKSLGFRVNEIADLACRSRQPYDLGTRCTVFMNSKVKQALRDGAGLADISAGLAYSVIKNALYKVLKIKDVNVLGDKIVVQGGTFKNPAVLRALELILGKQVIRPDISELMGAFGAALAARANALRDGNKSASSFSFSNLEACSRFKKKEIQCNGCENHCTVIRLTFENGNRFYTQNRCERVFSNDANDVPKGENLISEQLSLLFEGSTKPKDKPILVYGIPRCLNMYEEFPFWRAFLTECGFEVKISGISSFSLYEKGLASVMSENVCFPAKLAHGHIMDLVEKGVDRIFFPTVVYERPEFTDADDTFNCPVVTGYPDLLKSAIDPGKKFNIPIDNPAISFKNRYLLRDQLYLFFKRFGIDYKTISGAVKKGLEAQAEYEKKLCRRAMEVCLNAEKTGRLLIVLAGRPYHMDPLVNHGIPGLLAAAGVDVISEKAVSVMSSDISLSEINRITQWSYSNRVYAAAKWVAERENAQMVHLTSFGCGPDAVVADEVKDILVSAGKIHTLIKMDEIANLGAVKIRLRSMLEAVKEKRPEDRRRLLPDVMDKKNSPKPVDKSKPVLLVPFFSPLYSPLIPAGFRAFGLRAEVLPPQDRTSVEMGLTMVNNDICYPAVLIAGDIIKAFESGRYDPANTGVILTQTGGQCRASNYVSLIAKGLRDAGYDRVKIYSVTTEGINPAPEFTINEKELVKRIALGVIFADALARMYLSTLARETEPGRAVALHGKYLSEMELGIERADFSYLLALLRRAVSEFNHVPADRRPVPRIGVVGEIFVKYNFFANQNIVEWLCVQGVEPVLPPLQSFFTQRFINESYDQRALFKKSITDRIKYWLLEIYATYYLDRIESIMENFRFYRKTPDIRKMAELAEDVISLANQYGEGWLLTAEMAAMLHEGIKNIVCIQPFGCISNHITGKGMERKLKERFPAMNLLSIDMDAGASEVNIINRLHFLVAGAKQGAAPENRDSRRFPQLWKIPIPRPLPMVYYNSQVSVELEKWKAWISGLGLMEKAKAIQSKMAGKE